MDTLDIYFQWFLGFVLILSSLGIIFAKKPVHATLSFLLTLVTLASVYLHLHAPFISVMQIWVYAGAILVIFMFVIVLFQDAHAQIAKYNTTTYPIFLLVAAGVFLGQLIFEGNRLLGFSKIKEVLPAGFGTVQSIGRDLYLNFFFPFEAVVLLFLVAIIGSLFIAKKER